MFVEHGCDRRRRRLVRDAGRRPGDRRLRHPRLDRRGRSRGDRLRPRRALSRAGLSAPRRCARSPTGSLPNRVSPASRPRSRSATPRALAPGCSNASASSLRRGDVAEPVTGSSPGMRHEHPTTRRAFSRLVSERRYNGMRRVTWAVAFLVSLLDGPRPGDRPVAGRGDALLVRQGDEGPGRRHGLRQRSRATGSSGSVPIRNAGIQATEIARRSSATASAHATTFRSILHKGTKVRLSAKHKNSTAGRLEGAGRLRYWRYIDKWVPSTHSWVDVQALLLRHGDVMWLAHNAESRRGSRRTTAICRRAWPSAPGLWDNNYCGSGPSDSANLRMWLNYDANGRRRERSRTASGCASRTAARADVSIAGWKLRNASKDLRPRRRTTTRSRKERSCRPAGLHHVLLRLGHEQSRQPVASTSA